MARFAIRTIMPAALALVVTCAAFATARAQEGERPIGFFDRIFTGSERFGATDVTPAAGERTAQLSESDLLVRLDRLEAQIRQLTGQIEQLQYRNQQLEAQLRGMQPDGERRVGDAGSRAPARPMAPRAASAVQPRAEIESPLRPGNMGLGAAKSVAGAGEGAAVFAAAPQPQAPR